MLWLGFCFAIKKMDHRWGISTLPPPKIGRRAATSERGSPISGVEGKQLEKDRLHSLFFLKLSISDILAGV